MTTSMTTKRPGISLEEWYPLVKDLVPTPATRIVMSEVDLAPLLYAGDADAPDVSAAASDLATRIGEAVESIGGFPIFLRTGLMSGKHGWRETCLVERAQSLPSHIYRIVEYSELADVFGGRPTGVWIVRELLPTEPVFHAFYGAMPITKERRYFVKDGTVIGHHPYWPPDSIEQPDRTDWRERLDAINQETPDEVRLLTEWTERVGTVLPGAWSIDWLMTRNGWFLTDMAWAEQSFIWHDHPNAPSL